MSSGRAKNGQFATGNPGGPGRPRRAVEHDYLQVLRDTVPLKDWTEVVSKAVVDAKRGDARARDWVTKYLLGNDPPQLVELAALEQRGKTVDEVVDDLAGQQERDSQWAATTGQLLDDITKR